MLKKKIVSQKQDLHMPTRGEIHGQEWEVVNFGLTNVNNNKKANPQRQRDDEVHVPARKGQTLKARLDAETEELRHQRVPVDLKRALISARNAQGLSQKALAQAIQRPIAIVAEYERGSAIPDNALVAQMERVLRCRLPRVPRR
jgi:ribosome-binding protein aMBF1 (putative translation factor)